MNKKPLAILTADWHVTDATPVARTDNYFAAMNSKIDYILDIKEKCKCLLIIAGDVFDKPKSSPYIERWIINKLSKVTDLHIIPGQHDLLNHNIENFESSSIGVLEASIRGTVHRTPFGDIEDVIGIGVVHRFIQRPFDAQDDKIGGDDSLRYLKKHKRFPVIVSGDNHKSFVVKHDGRVLVNCGSIMRMDADQIDYQPAVWLWYGDDIIEPEYLPIASGVISREHLEKKEARDAKFDSYILRMKDNYEIGLSYEKNLESNFRTNNVRKPVQSIIWEAMGK